MERVMIVGGPGSGKSTLARALGARTGLPVFHMDHLHWKPGWQPRSMDEKRPMALAVEAQSRWIFEGGLSDTYDNRASRADTLIWLDLPVGLRLWRVTKRSVLYAGQVRPDMADGCPEGFHGETPEFYRYIWRTRQSSRARVQRLIRTHGAGLGVVHLRAPRAVRDWLRGLPDAPPFPDRPH
ncbi:MAG: AAA family ATPase [Marinibacterium sp.]|nr:AAA family ATPase [Marinibacterium sp.]